MTYAQQTAGGRVRFSTAPLPHLAMWQGIYGSTVFDVAEVHHDEEPHPLYKLHAPNGDRLLVRGSNLVCAGEHHVVQ